jgi:hypothetical protein
MSIVHEQLLAKAGPAVTIASATTSFVATALPVVQFIGAVVAVLVGIATFIYYALSVREKIRALRAKK